MKLFKIDSFNIISYEILNPIRVKNLLYVQNNQRETDTNTVKKKTLKHPRTIHQRTPKIIRIDKKNKNKYQLVRCWNK